MDRVTSSEATGRLWRSLCLALLLHACAAAFVATIRPAVAPSPVALAIEVAFEATPAPPAQPQPIPQAVPMPPVPFVEQPPRPGPAELPALQPLSAAPLASVPPPDAIPSVEPTPLPGFSLPSGPSPDAIPPDIVPTPSPVAPLSRGAISSVAAARLPTPHREATSSSATPPRPKPQPKSARTQPGTEAVSPTSGLPNAVPPDPSPAPPATAMPAIAPSWQGELSAWLQAHKNYPMAARMAGESGTVGVRFTVDRNGQVLDVSVVRSSGSSRLDGGAIETLRHGRLPPFPSSMTQERATVTVAIHYRLDD